MSLSQVVKRMVLPENMESLAAACPGLSDDKARLIQSNKVYVTYF